MIAKLTYADDCVLVYAGDTTLKTTKAFTHGSILFDVNAKTVTFAKLPPVAIPDGLQLEAGKTLKFQLVAPDGKLRPQTRSGALVANEKQPGVLHIGGMAQSPRLYSAEDGWGNVVYKCRAYFEHPGLDLDVNPPEWLQNSIKRQREYWNRLAWLCRDARRKCSPVPTEEIIQFTQSTILPAIDALNDSLGVSKQKMKHPAKLKVEEPGLDGLWHFVGELRGRIEKGRPVPDGLLEKVVAFAEPFKADYTPLNEFMLNFSAIAEKETAALNLRRFEIRPIVTSFKAALKHRKSAKMAWSDGWPMIKYPNSPKADDWGLHYYFNKAGVSSSLLETSEGVPGLTFGPPLDPAETNHKNLRNKRGKTLREAEISIPGDNKERWTFRFGVLQWRALPPNSHVKEWNLLFLDGKLWLCLLLELQYPRPVLSNLAAGMEIGWRRTKEGIRFATLYEPSSGTMRELTMDLEHRSKGTNNRTPFRIDLGPAKWNSGCARTRQINRELMLFFPEWQKNGILPNPMEIKIALHTRLSLIKDQAKIRLRKHLGDAAPAWLDRAGSRGLRQLKEQFKDDPEVQTILNPWETDDERIGILVSMYNHHLTACIEDNQGQVATDICHYLMEKGVTRLILESNFLAKVAQNQDSEDPVALKQLQKHPGFKEFWLSGHSEDSVALMQSQKYRQFDLTIPPHPDLSHVALKRSQKYRQFVGVGKFVQRLKNSCPKYGILVEMVNPINITRICQYCDHLNPATEKETYQCEQCHRVIRQDQNSAVNLSRFGTNAKLAEMALNAGREAQEDDETGEDRADGI